MVDMNVECRDIPLQDLEAVHTAVGLARFGVQCEHHRHVDEATRIKWPGLDDRQGSKIDVVGVDLDLFAGTILDMLGQHLAQFEQLGKLLELVQEGDRRLLIQDQ